MKFELSTLGNLLQFPSAFEIVADPAMALARLRTSWAPLSARRHKLLLLCGHSGATRLFADEYAALFAPEIDFAPLFFAVEHGSLAEVATIDALCARDETTLVLAIGGGRVIDTAKALVTRRNLDLIVVPAALSSDGIASPVSVLRDDAGIFRSLPSGIPSCVVVDLSLTLRAPLEMTRSGIGDIVSNISALLDVEDLQDSGSGRVDGFARILSQAAHHMLLPLQAEDLQVEAGHERIASGLILSGLAMGFAGNSLPCSGSEHLISHAIDQLKVGHGTHGQQVAVTSLFCIELRRQFGLRGTLIDVADLIARLGLPRTPEALGISREEVFAAVRITPTVRPGRFSILAPAMERPVFDAVYDAAYPAS